MKHSRITEIDLLRFLAALGVVLFHYMFAGYMGGIETKMAYPLLAPYAQYGYLGVQLFFMISGFVILMTATGATLSDFAISRFVRIFPALWVCCSATYVCSVIFADEQFSKTFGTYIANLFLLNKLLGFENVDGAYWSLFYELQFYAFVAVFVYLKKIDKYPLFLLAWLVVSILETIFARGGRLSNLLLGDTSGCFIAGSVLYLMHSKGANLWRWLMLVAAWGLTIHQSIRVVPRMEAIYKTQFSAMWIAVVVSSFFAILLFVVLRRTGFLGKRSWALWGAITYPLYLLHQNIGFMVINKLYPDLSPNAILWPLIASMIVIAACVHYLVEKPLSKLVKTWLLVGTGRVK